MDQIVLQEENNLRELVKGIQPPKIENVVSTVNLSCQLDLMKISHNARLAEYNPKRFSAVIMRLTEPKTTALVFQSGKMVCTGAKSEEQSLVAARKYAKIIQKLGFPVVFKDFMVQNIVASFDFRKPIKLDEFTKHERHQNFVQYEPEIFPGLIYRRYSNNNKITLLIFVSGKY
ncbi:hypothetical protein pb186bvf_017849 [Paramecium bursaria]